MPRISKEEMEARRNEIIDACEALYQSASYHDITMTQVAERVSCGRANVYNYFQNKDEVLLALLQREHELWAQDLATIANGAGLDDDQLADRLAASVEFRAQMLKLLAMNLYDIEQNSRPERLTEFKVTYGRVIDALRQVLRACKPGWDESRIDRFVYCFMPFLHGAYPYAFHSEKQVAAMESAGVPHPPLSVRSLVSELALKLLQDDR